MSLQLYGASHCSTTHRWGVLFSHPADFTPVCTTELGVVAKMVPEFEKRNAKVIALSCDSVEDHKKWIQDIKVFILHIIYLFDFISLQAYNNLGDSFPYSIISDPKRELAVQLGMVDPVEKDKAGLPLTCRAVRNLSTCIMLTPQFCTLPVLFTYLGLHCRYLSLVWTRSSSCKYYILLRQGETLSKSII